MYAWYCLLALVAGTLIPLQAGINAQLRSALQSPWCATLVSVLVSSVSVFLFCLVIRAPVPAVQAFVGVLWWAWTGGIVGVVYICMALMLGATALIASLIAGQLICSLVLDQFAWAGFAQHGISAGRIAGVVLLVVGTLLIERY